MNTWIKRWADLRRKELISYPESMLPNLRIEIQTGDRRKRE